jgi:hypothetical protein
MSTYGKECLIIDSAFCNRNSSFLTVRVKTCFRWVLCCNNFTLCFWQSSGILEVLRQSIQNVLSLDLFLSSASFSAFVLHTSLQAGTSTTRCGFGFGSWLCHLLGCLTSYLTSLSLVIIICVFYFFSHC